MDNHALAVNWLLHSEDPSFRYFALTEIIGEPEESKEVQVKRVRWLVRHRLHSPEFGCFDGLFQAGLEFFCACDHKESFN